MRFIQYSFVIWFVLGASFSEVYGNTNPYESDSVEKVVDFRLFYPVFDLREDRNIRLREKNYMGIDLIYQWYFADRISVAVDSGFWFAPVRLNEDNSYLSLYFLQAGLGFRPLPKSYMNPNLFLLGGFGFSDIGRLVEMKSVYPMSVRLSIDTLKSTDQYTDRSLALGVWTSYQYIYHSLNIMNSSLYDVGLSLRGTF